jgi:NADH-quinone oxidoreductase subunit G
LAVPAAASFRPAVKDFYLTNPIARASKIMAECSALKNVQKLEAAE